MGTVKYKENNEEVTNERLYERENVIPFEPKIIYYDCYYCKQSFESSQGRNSHIKSSHNVVGPLLFINGKIASDKNYIETIISAKIALCGFSNVNISVDNEKIEIDNVEIDIISYFKNEYDYNSINIGQKLFIINKYQTINISSTVIENIINNWETQILNSQSLSPSQESYPTTLNEAEKRYLNGFFDYYIACRATDSTNKRDRYNTAFALLSGFNKLPPKATVLLKVIAFRFNWIETLEHLSTETTRDLGVFDTVVDFYYGRESAIFEIADTKEKEQSIYVEDDVEECINVILAFQNNQLNLVDHFLEKWTDEEVLKVEDTNKKDRLLLLKARRIDIKYFDDIKTPFLYKIAEVERNRKYEFK